MTNEIMSDEIKTEGRRPMNRLERRAARWIVDNTKGATRDVAHHVLQNFAGYGAAALIAITAPAWEPPLQKAFEQDHAETLHQEGLLTKAEMAAQARQIIRNKADVEDLLRDYPELKRDDIIPYPSYGNTTGVSEDMIKAEPDKYTYDQRNYLGVRRDASGKILCGTGYDDGVSIPCKDMGNARRQFEAQLHADGLTAKDAGFYSLGLGNTGEAQCGYNELHKDACTDMVAQKAEERARLRCLGRVDSRMQWDVRGDGSRHINGGTLEIAAGYNNARPKAGRIENITYSLAAQVPGRFFMTFQRNDSDKPDRLARGVADCFKRHNPDKFDNPDAMDRKLLACVRTLNPNVSWNVEPASEDGSRLGFTWISYNSSLNIGDRPVDWNKGHINGRTVDFDPYDQKGASSTRYDEEPRRMPQGMENGIKACIAHNPIRTLAWH